MKASISGHIRNVANFEKLVSACKSLGLAYNPAHTSLSILKLEETLAAAETVLRNHNEAAANLRNTLNARREAYKPLNRVATKAVNALASFQVSEKELIDARAFQKKISGRRIHKAKPTDNTAETDVATHTTTQMSFDLRIENFEKLIELLTQNTKYNPNEPDMTVAGLRATAADIQAKNTAANDAFFAEQNARTQRHITFYAAGTGLFDIAASVKKYLRSVFDTSNVQVRTVLGLKFRQA